MKGKTYVSIPSKTIHDYHCLVSLIRERSYPVFKIFVIYFLSFNRETKKEKHLYTERVLKATLNE